MEEHRVEFADLVRIQEEEFKRVSEKDKALASPTFTSSRGVLIKPWPKPGDSEAFHEAAKDIELKASYMCPILKRPAYDMVILKLEADGYEDEQTLSHEAAHRWLIDQKQTTCPVTRLPVKSVAIPRVMRESIREEIQKILNRLKYEAEEKERIAYEIERQKKEAKAAEEKARIQRLQDALIAACEAGDEKEVKGLLERGAKAGVESSKGLHPLGAAVWGMNPAVVNCLMEEIKRVSNLTWKEVEAHNLKYYKEVFMFNEFKPQTYKEWHTLLLKMNRSPFLATQHLAEAKKMWLEDNTSSWEKFVAWVGGDGICWRFWRLGTRYLVSSAVNNYHSQLRVNVTKEVEQSSRFNWNL